MIRARSRLGTILALLGVALTSALAVCGPRQADAQPSLPGLAGNPPDRERDPGEAVAMRATEAIHAMDYDRARADLAKADPNSPAVVLAKARLALHEEDCDLAAALMGMGRHDAALSDEGRLIAEVARGCARVTAATVVDKDEASGVVLRWHDQADRALAPLIIDTVNKARAALTRDLGVEWKKPLRITVVRDLLSLSAMTGLPYKSAQTTGTVAVAKWGRVTILSPRASKHGYPWRDTLTHELTHVAISMQTRDRAPLWLHEGVARRQETRWREPGPFDDRPSPESVVQRGMELKLDLALDKLGPSIAMLPSADAAMVAFAEVTSFVRFLVDSSAEGTLAKVLIALRTTKTVDEALQSVTGETLAQWDVKWRAMLARRPKEALSPLYGLGGNPPGLGDSRERSRLAELLYGRGHAAEALVEIDKIPEALFSDPSLRYLKGRVLETKGDAQAAEVLVDDPKAWVTSFGPCWAIRARLLKERADATGVTAADAQAASTEALAHDPLTVETACRVNPADPAPAGPVSGAGLGGGPLSDDQGKALCDAARKADEPDVGRD